MRVILHVSPREPVFAPNIREKKDAVSARFLEGYERRCMCYRINSIHQGLIVGMPMEGSLPTGYDHCRKTYCQHQAAEQGGVNEIMANTAEYISEQNTDSRSYTN
jgi:hypothetical protein